MNIHITLTEVITTLIMYLIVHGILWFGKNVEKFAITEYHRLMIGHTKNAHEGRLEGCSRCLTGKNLDQLLTVELR